MRAEMTKLSLKNIYFGFIPYICIDLEDIKYINTF